jgi:hypothetical protein
MTVEWQAAAFWSAAIYRRFAFLPFLPHLAGEKEQKAKRR